MMRNLMRPHPLIAGSHCTVLAAALVSFTVLPGPARSDEPDASLVRSSGPLTADEERTRLKVPQGFDVRLFAAEPMINKPMNLAFDSRGRLWVSSTTEYPYPAPKNRWVDAQGSRVRDSRDAIKILEDTDGDGRADTVTDFADGLNVPIGVLPYKNGCLAWSIPNIWYFEDTDGDGKCDKRSIVFGPLGYEKDTHGDISSLRLAPDGWVYATHGFNNTTHFEVRPENRRGPEPASPKKPTPSAQNTSLPRDQLDWGNSLDVHSGNVFRFKPDGSAVEIWAWGQVNPFGLTWDSWGNLYSADCHSNPITQIIRGAFYPSFGKPDDGMGFGPVLCEHAHGSTGICGPLYLDGGVWGPEWDDHMIVCNPVTSRINHDLITFTGSTPKANERDDFIISDDPWFRPVDVQLGPDGALYVADFYNKIIGHYEVPLTHPGRDRERGRIWKIVKDGVTRGERRLTARQEESRRWRFVEPQAPNWSADRTAAAVAMIGAPDTDPRTSRVIAEALTLRSAAGDSAAVLRALDACNPADASLHHTLALALRQRLSAPDAWATLKTIALTPKMETDLARIALAVNTPDAATFLLGSIQKHPTSGNELLKTLSHIARTGGGPAELGGLATFAKTRFAHDPDTQADLVQAVINGLAERGSLPDGTTLGWAQDVAAMLLASLGENATPEWEAGPNTLLAGLPPSKNPWVQQERPAAEGPSLQTISSLEIGGDAPERRTGLLRSKAFPAPATLDLWICGHRGPPDQPPHEKNLVRLVDAATGAELARAFPPRADSASRTTWNLDQHAGKSVRLELVDGDTGDAYAWLALGRVDPPVVKVDAFRAQDETRARLQSLAAVLKHAAPRDLREKLAAFLPPPPPPPPSVVTPEQRAELDALIKSRLAGLRTAQPNLPHGEQVFTTNCAICHAIGGKGALVGPQLDGVGNRGADRLMEDIIDPNRNVDANFYVHLITKKDGSVFAGLERGTVGEVLLGVDATGKEQRLAKADIEKNELTGLSLMPAAFGQSIPDADFNDLLAWLLTHRAPQR